KNQLITECEDCKFDKMKKFLPNRQFGDGVILTPSSSKNGASKPAAYACGIHYLTRRSAKGTRNVLPLVAAITPMMQNTRWHIPTAAITNTPTKITVRINPAT